MNLREKSAGRMDKMDNQEVRNNSGADGSEDLALEEALGNFKDSVHAWSEAAYSRPRTAVQAVRRRSWRLAAGWALAVVLVTGSVAGSVFERHEQKMRIAEAARVAQQQRLAAENRALDEEDLLAKVDNDISRDVPNAMEPLAQLMAEGDIQ
jgi:hypothetical protein